MTIRAAIIAAYERRGWTQQQLADAADMKQPHISEYLSGATDVRTETADRLLKALKLEIKRR